MDQARREDVGVRRRNAPIAVLDEREKSGQRLIVHRLIVVIAAIQQAAGKAVILADGVVDLGDDLVIIDGLLAGERKNAQRPVGERNKGAEEILGGWVQAARRNDVVWEIAAERVFE